MRYWTKEKHLRYYIIIQLFREISDNLKLQAKNDFSLPITCPDFVLSIIFTAYLRRKTV